ncbi:MAG: phosphatidate cytidylyltransferase [Phycisphaeraceae bacterium]|nr:phosphatidate cytidylyltransferase [Phycisphaeraceae bacterium]
MTPPFDQPSGLAVAFDHVVTRGIVIGVATLLVLTPIIIAILKVARRIDEPLQGELYRRYVSWLVLAPLMLGPIVLGRLWTIGAVVLLSLLCYREFARTTGLFRHRLLSGVVVLGLLAIGFAVADHWYAFFVALPSLTICLLVVAGLVADQPSGYIQRVALSVFSLLLFGVCLGHLAYFANDRLFRPLMLLILLSVELNDVFAFVVGKSIGRRRFAPNTSPNKTLAGALGAAILTTVLFATLAHFVFAGTVMDGPVHLVTMGLLLSVCGQFGDLVLSSIKRDLGIKDMAATIPGHGGLLDRFDSLLLVAPVLFHYIGYVRGIGLDQPERIFSGNGM